MGCNDINEFVLDMLVPNRDIQTFPAQEKKKKKPNFFPLDVFKLKTKHVFQRLVTCGI